MVEMVVQGTATRGQVVRLEVMRERVVLDAVGLVLRRELQGQLRVRGTERGLHHKHQRNTLLQFVFCDPDFCKTVLTEHRYRTSSLSQQTSLLKLAGV